MKHRPLVHFLLLLLLAAGWSGCGVFKSKKCDCPSWGQRTVKPPAERPA